MTSRILIDVRGGEGVILAALLRDCGLIVEEVTLVRDRTREPRIGSETACAELCTPERARLLAPSQFFQGSHQSSEAIDAPLLGEAMARLADFLLRSVPIGHSVSSR